MDALKGLVGAPPPPSPALDRRLRAFRATDAFVFAVFHGVRDLPRAEGQLLASEIRKLAARVGGALVGAAQAPGGVREERREVARARAGLLELRYYLYLARRLGVFDLKRYRALAASQDAALRELDLLLGAGPDSSAGAGRLLPPPDSS